GLFYFFIGATAYPVVVFPAFTVIHTSQPADSGVSESDGRRDITIPVHLILTRTYHLLDGNGQAVLFQNLLVRRLDATFTVYGGGTVMYQFPSAGSIDNTASRLAVFRALEVEFPVTGLHLQRIHHFN